MSKISNPHAEGAGQSHESLRSAFSQAHEALMRYPSTPEPGLSVHDRDTRYGHARILHVRTADQQHWVSITANGRSITRSINSPTMRRLPHGDLETLGFAVPESEVDPAALELDQYGLSLQITVKKAPPSGEVKQGAAGALAASVRRALGGAGLKGIATPLNELPLGNEFASFADMRWFNMAGEWKLFDSYQRGTQYDPAVSRLLVGTGLDLIMPVEELDSMTPSPEGFPKNLYPDAASVQSLATLPDAVKNYLPQ